MNTELSFLYYCSFASLQLHVFDHFREPTVSNLLVDMQVASMKFPCSLVATRSLDISFLS